MSATVADLKAKISIDGAEKAKKDIADLKGKRGSGSSGSGILGLVDGFKTGLGAVTGFITGFEGFKIAEDALGMVKDQLLDVLQAGMDQQKVMAQTAAVIASTGGAAHVSAAQVGDYADALARMSGISDDTIQGSENLLLTFRAVGKDIFPQATKTILDMSVAMHEDLNSATIQVGKALQDPIHGVTTLQRVGVQLNDSQKTLIATYMKHNQVAKAQGVILDELTKEFGGSAEAAGKTLPGQLARLNVSWDQAKEKIGLAVIPILQSLIEKYLMPAADWLGKHLPAAIDTLTGFIDNTLLPAVEGFMNSPFVKTIEGWALAIGDKLDPKLGDMKTHTKNATDELERLKNKAHETGNELDPNFKNKVHNSTDELSRMVDKISNGNEHTAVIPALDAYDDRLIRAHAAQVKANQSASQSIPILSGLGEAFGHLLGIIGQVKDTIGGFFAGIGERLGPAEPAIKNILDSIGNDFGMFGDGIHAAWDGLWGTLAFPVKILFHQLQGMVNVGLDVLAGNFDKAKVDANTMLQNMIQDVKDFGLALTGLLGGIAEAALGWLLWPLNEALRLVGVKWDNLKQLFLHLGSTLQPVLQQMGLGWITHLGDGIEQGKQWVLDRLNDVLRAAQQFINDHTPHWPGISLPGQQRASGGPVSGAFVGAERGMELLVTPGIYTAPPGSYVYNNSETQRMLSSGRGASSVPLRGGDTFNVTIIGANKTAAQLFDEMKREADFRRRGHGG